MLLSAGWVWHPFDSVVVYDIPQVLRNPSVLDTTQSFHWRDSSAEIPSAAFVSDNLLVLTSSPDAEDNWDEVAIEERMAPGKIGVFDIQHDKYLSIVPCE
jgi:hypothetical protein